MISSMISSMIVRSPRAPVLRPIASVEMARSASSVKISSTPSISRIF